MQDLALYIIKQLVNHPDDVTVEEQNSGQGEVTLLLNVNPEDMGIVIGKSGQTIKAVRRILSIRAMAENVRVSLQLSEPEGGSKPSAVSTQSSEEVIETEEVEGQGAKESEEITENETTAESEQPVTESQSEEHSNTDTEDNSKKDES